MRSYPDKQGFSQMIKVRSTMKRVGFLLASFILIVLFSTTSYGRDMLRTKYFQIVIPEGWDIEIKDNNVLFVKATDECEEASLYVSIGVTKSNWSLNETWQHIGENLLPSNSIIQSSEEVEMNKESWKKVVFSQDIFNSKYKGILLFAVRDHVRYSILYMCIDSKYEETTIEIIPVMNSFEMR